MSERDDQAVTQGTGRRADPEARDVDPSRETVTVATEPRGAPPEADAIERYERIERYVVLEPLGKGGMGVVYGAYDPKLRRRVALKVIRADVVGPDGHARMLREARAMARLSHPNVLPVYDAGLCDDTVFIAMEQVEGRTLRAWMDEGHPWPRVLDVFGRAGDGLAAAHAEGLVHRDFKPDNVMIDDRGRVRVLDFGLVTPWAAPAESRELRELYDVPLDDVATRLTRQGRALGTPAYMAPEQHEGQEIDGRADQYAFCVALYEALYGTRPFGGRSLLALVESKRDGPPRAPRSRVPAALERVVRRGLARSPDERWNSLPELLAALARVPRSRRRRGWIAALGLGGAVVVGLSWPRAGSCGRIEPLPVPSTASPHLVQQAGAWHERVVAVCEAEHEPPLEARIRWCLDEVRTELLVAAQMPRSVELRSARSCDDASVLMAWTQDPPSDPAPVLELRGELVRARASMASNATYEDLVERARGTGDLRVLAEAQLAHARALLFDGVSAGFVATASAMDANDAELEARGWLVALEHMAADPARHPEVLGWHSVAEAVVARSGVDARLVARLALVFEGPLRSSGRSDEAQSALERARRHPEVATLTPDLRRRLDAALAR